MPPSTAATGAARNTAPGSPTVAILTLPGERASYGGQDMRAADERWHLSKRGVRVFVSGVLTALRDHGDVTKYYCFDEHTRIPDMVIIASSVWNKFSDEQKSIVAECAATATEEYKDAWKKFEDEVLDKAVNQNGVELVKDVDIAAFQTAVQPIYDNLKTSNPTTYAVVEEIRAMA